MAKKEDLLKALDEIKEGYDAYYIQNKYGNEKTHQKQFDMLKELKGDRVPNALNWITYCYDCYYKDDYKDERGTAFEYLRNLINEQGE